MTAIPEIKAFLLCETPDAWVQNALDNLDILLVDHANCELKAAQTAQQLMWKYGVGFRLPGQGDHPGACSVDPFDLLNKMSRLAREELRHFEQVIALMAARDIDYSQIQASRYAAELRKLVRKGEQENLIDILIAGAIIEARSCERFEKLAPLLDDELKKFYLSLLKSEARHYQDYLQLAQQAAGHEDIQPRIDEFLAREQALIVEPDSEFRFHSGPLV